MRPFLLLSILWLATIASAQFPPIALEWSALRPYGDGDAFISHDPVLDDYAWVVYNPADIGDHVIFPFLPDGTDLAPSYPSALSVGSLDLVVDVDKVNGAFHSVIRHQYLDGDIMWHLDDLWVNNSMSDIYLEDYGYDLLVAGGAVYGVGQYYTSWTPDLASLAQVIKLDLQGNVLWNVTWDGNPAMPLAQFSSIAVIGDSVFCAAFPMLVILNNTTGAIIDAIDISQGNGAIDFHVRFLTNGDRVYWSGGGYIGYYDASNDQSAFISSTGAGRNIAIDQYDHVWTASGNTWSRHDLELSIIDSGTLYNGIHDMRFVNGKISFTGKLDTTTTTTYVITGTPQP